MSRRKRARSRTIWLDWNDAVAKYFDLVPASWTPPSKVKVQGTMNRSTWSARFTTPSGGSNLARIRVRYDRHAAAHFIVGSELELLKVRITAQLPADV